MKNPIYLLRQVLRSAIVLAVLVSLLVACGGTPEPTQPPPPPTAPLPTETPTPLAPVSEEPVVEPVTSDLRGIRWKWELYEDPGGANNLTIDNPDSYTVVFLPNGEINIQADCNRIGGTYTTQDTALTLELGFSTMAFCGEGSLDHLFLGFLSDVGAFAIQDAKLILNVQTDASNLIFQNGGQAEVASPGAGAMDLTTPTWLWSEWIETEPAGQTIVPDPQNYPITFLPDAHFGYVADCNSGSGTYTMDGNNLALELGPATEAECGAGSLSQTYQTLLSQVSSYSLEEGRLLLNLGDNAGQLILIEAVPAGTGGVGIDLRSITLDTMGLPYSWQPSIVPATPYDNSQPPGPTGLPEHVQINFGVTAPEDKHAGDPVIYIIPASDYEQLWQASDDPSISSILEHLETMLVERPLPVPPFGMPILPLEELNGINDLAVQGSYPDFGGWGGVRFVGRFAQNASPVTGEGLRYIFQGFSGDGRYLITFFYPVTTQALPASAENIPAEEQARLDSDLGGYMEAKSEMLNALAPSDWEPDLTTLDAVLGSLTFQTTDGEPDSEITNIEWRWSELLESEPAGQSVVPNPENYLLIFRANGQYNVKADCNSGSGMYIVEGNNLSLEPGPMTMAECGADSLYDQYVALLGQANSYILENERLVLNLDGEAGQMIFDNGGTVR